MKVYVLYGSFCTSADGNDCMTPKVFGSVAAAREHMRSEVKAYIDQWTGDSGEPDTVDDSDPDHTYVSINDYDIWSCWDIVACNVADAKKKAK